MTIRLALTSGSAFSIGAGSSTTTVFGTEGNDRLTIAAGTTVILDASFNRGGDTITLAGNAASYTVTKRGSSVILTDAAGSVTIPVGVVGGNIVFADAAARSLVSTTTGAFTLGSQPVTETASAVTAGTVAPAGSAFILSTGVDTGDGFTGTARNDTFNATQLTLNPGDSLVGGDGTDTLQITSVSAAATLGGDALVSGIEVVNTTATVSAVTVNLGTFSGVTTVGSSGSTAGVTYANVQSIPVVNVSGTSANVDVSVAAAAVAGPTDAAMINLTSVGSTASNVVTINGVEAITVNTTGNIGATQIDGATINRTTIASTTLNSVIVNGTGSTNLEVNLAGAPVGATATPGVFTGSAGADDVVLTIPAGSRLTANLGTGNDTLRLGVVTAAMTINGGEGTDTLVYTGTAAVAAAATAGITANTFERVVITNGASFDLATSNLTYSGVAAGTYTNLAAGGTVALQAGGTLTLANTALTGTTDAVTFTVGTATATTVTGATIDAGTHDVVTVTGVARADVAATNNAAISVSGTTLNTITLNSSQGVTLTGGGAALTTINASGVAGTFSTTATVSPTAAVTITGGAGNDIITGGALGDSLVGGAGNDTITGNVGADTMTGGAGADTFVIAANTATSSASTVGAPDVISDFTSGTDKLSVSATAFLGNFANIQQALAANAAPGVAAGSAAFVTGESNLYVFTAAGANLNVIDRVVTLTGVTSLPTNGSDLLLGSQGPGATIVTSATTAATTLPAVGPTTASVENQRTTNFDDTMTAARSATANSLTGVGAAIDGGLGNDTLIVTIETSDLLTSLSAATAVAEVNLASVETVNITSTASGVVNLGAAGIDTEIRTLTVSSPGVTGVGLTATTTAANQSITVNNTVLAANAGQISTITVGNFANNRVTTGSGNDAVIVTGGTGTTGLNVDTGAGNDTVAVGAATVFTGAGNVLNGGTDTTGGVDTLGVYALAATENLDLAALALAGTIVGFEAVTIADSHDSAHTVTLATGITSVTISATKGDAATYNVTGTAAQVSGLALRSDFSTNTMNLLITTGGSVSSGTLTNVDLINFGSTEAITLTLGGTVATANTQTGTGSAATTVNVFTTTFTNQAAAAPTLVLTPAQVVTAVSTGAVTFNIARDALQVLTADNVGDITLASAAAATTTLNVTSSATTTYDANGTNTAGDAVTAITFTDADLAFNGANIDIVRIGDVTTAQAFSFGTGLSTTSAAGDLLQTAGQTITVAAAETGTTQVSYSIATDSAGTSDTLLAITGFDATTIALGGDVLDLQAVGAGVVARTVATTGASLGAAAAAGAIVEMIIGNTVAAQINGALTQTTDAGAVEAAIVALGLVAASAAPTNIYITLDNGTDTGVYRVTVDGDGGANNIIDTVGEITSVVLVATLAGIADVGTLGSFNFA